MPPKRSSARLAKSYEPEPENTEADEAIESPSKKVKILNYDPAEEVKFLKAKLDEERLRRRELETEIIALKVERQDMCNKMNKLETSKIATIVPSSLLPILSDAMSRGLDPAKLATPKKQAATSAPSPAKAVPRTPHSRDKNPIVTPNKSAAQKQSPAAVLVQSVTGKPVTVAGQRYVIEHRVANGQTIQMLVPVPVVETSVSTSVTVINSATPTRTSPRTSRSALITATTSMKDVTKESNASQAENTAVESEALIKAGEQIQTPKSATENGKEEEEHLPLIAASSSLTAAPIETPASPDPSDQEAK